MPILPNNLDSPAAVSTPEHAITRAGLGYRSAAHKRNADAPVPFRVADDTAGQTASGLPLHRNDRGRFPVSGNALGSAVAKQRQLRLGTAVTLLLALSVGPSFAEMPIAKAEGSLAAARAKPTSDELAIRRQAIADCEDIWDAKTHMTKQEWLRTCTRVQTRIQQLNVNEALPLSEMGARSR